MAKLKKIKIVIEETGSDDGKGFILYMEGDKERIGRISENELGAAEFWGSKLFSICVSAVTKANAVTNVGVKNDEASH